MTTYFIRDPSGKILQSSPLPYEDDFKLLPDFSGCSWEETEELIVCGYDGLLYLKSTEPAIPVAVQKRLNATFVEVSPTPEALLKEEVRTRLAVFASGGGYSDITSARIASGPFANDAIKANDAYNRIWAAYLGLLPMLKAGTMTWQKAKDSLPVLVW